MYDHLNQVLAFLNTDFFWSFAPHFKAFDMDLTGEENPPVQEMLRDLGRDGIAKAHAGLEAMMGGREWLAGDTRTIADAYFTGIARWAPFLASTGAKTVDQRDYPRLYRHIQKLEADPAVVFAHAIEDEKPATTSGFSRPRLDGGPATASLPIAPWHACHDQPRPTLVSTVSEERGEI